MMPVDAVWRRKMRPALLTAVLLLAGLDCSAAVAQNIMRSPSLNISSRIPRIDPNLAGRALPGIAVDNLRIRSPCEAADRDSGNCSGSVAGNTTSRKNRNKTASTSSGASLGVGVISNEIVAEIDGALSEAQVDALARRHGLRRIDSRNFELLGSTIGLFRIVGGKPPEAAGRNFAQDGSVRSVQPNLHYTLQDQHAGEGDPAQYPQAKLHLVEAHALSEGVNVTVAVIDSGIDLAHGEFTGVTITPFDALESKEGPHAHGTGVAGAIVSHVRVMGSAPAAHILAIRAFGTSGKGAESTSYTLLKAFDLAASHGAQIVNMSFAGPKDGLVGRCLSALAARHIVMVAAAGNAGPKSPPLYPAADANVIAVGATDAHDRLFSASNRGSYIAVSAPGVDIFLPAPDNKYQITSGTSFSSAFVSGLAALMLQRNPALKADEVRAILMKTARDLGPPGPDDQFGAGEADAFAAVSAVPVASLPVATASERPTPAAISRVPNTEPAETRDISAATTAADKAPGGEATPNPNQTKPGTR